MNLSLALWPSSLDNMSFSTHSRFSTSYQTLGSMKSFSHWVLQASSVASTYAVSGGLGSQISVFHPTSIHRWLGIQGPGCGDGWGPSWHRGHPDQEVDYAMLEWLHSLLAGEGEEPGGWLIIRDWRAKSWNTWRRRNPRSETGDVILRSSRKWGLRSLQVLWTMPASFYRLTIPALLMTSVSSMRQSWPRASLRRMTSMGSERSLMAAISLDCSWRQRLRLSRGSCFSWRRTTRRK